METPVERPKWQKTNTVNIVRYRSGILYSRAKVRGKIINRSLGTAVMEIARARLNELMRQERIQADSKSAIFDGILTFGKAATIFKNRLNDDPALKPRSKAYRLERLKALQKTWADLETMDVRRISKAKCLEWAAKFRKLSSANAYNNTVGTLRMILAIAIETGAISYNPAMEIKKAREVKKHLKLPSDEEFSAVVLEVESVKVRYSQPCADLIRFLAYGGFRKSEAKKITWGDCDFVRETILVRGDVETGTKNWTVRQVMMIPQMKSLLERLRHQRAEEPHSSAVMTIGECQGAITRACRRLNIPRFTHHDLRHLFATRCMELGVDILTIAQWLGHKDGGSLLLKTYAHLRTQHSSEMAKKVVFREAPLK